MNRHFLGAVLALATGALAACDGTGSTDSSLLGSRGGSSGATPPGVFDTSTNPSPGGTPPSASAGAAGSSGTGSGASTGSGGAGAVDAGNPSIDDRVVDYGEALRTATIKLIGVMPDLVDIQAIQNAGSQAAQKTAYEAQIDKLLADTRFADTQITWWKNTFKTGSAVPGTATVAPAKNAPSFDTAAMFAASVVVGDRPYTDILTATTGTCPTYANGTFTPANCTNGAPTAGVLSDPGIQSQYFGHMAFRRVRFVQETFACSAFPAEFSPTPVSKGAGMYTSPWDFNSITGGATAKIDFQNTDAIVCANCHTSLNHIAPLFANFDANGKYTANAVQVQTPVTPPVTSALADWLPAGQSLAWRNGVTVTDIPSLGAAMANDNDVQRCAVTRVWNWAFSRGDVVNDIAPVPTSVTDSYLAAFQANGLKVKALIRGIFTSDDFVKF